MQVLVVASTNVMQPVIMPRSSAIFDDESDLLSLLGDWAWSGTEKLTIFWNVRK